MDYELASSAKSLFKGFCGPMSPPHGYFIFAIEFSDSPKETARLTFFLFAIRPTHCCLPPPRTRCVLLEFYYDRICARKTRIRSRERLQKLKYNSNRKNIYGNLTTRMTKATVFISVAGLKMTYNSIPPACKLSNSTGKLFGKSNIQHWLFSDTKANHMGNLCFSSIESQCDPLALVHLSNQSHGDHAGKHPREELLSFPR